MSNNHRLMDEPFPEMDLEDVAEGLGCDCDEEEEERMEVEAIVRSPSEEAEQARIRVRLFKDGSAYKRTFRDEIVGIDNILGEIEEIIHWLRHSREYDRHNSRLQPGVVFSGSPGTGKTLVSRWIATASDALFVNVRDFVHKGSLFTDRDIAELFRHARLTYAQGGRPIVLFWDEFETAARERGDNGTTPEQRSTVSQLTAELDGIHGKNAGILLVGCTNYESSIDQALLRRGRMGVHIEFHSPDRGGKEKILAYYLAQMTTTSDIDIHTLSYFFPRENTAADIEEACVEAWRHAVRRSIDDPAQWPLPVLAQEDLVKVFIKQLVGPPTTFTIPEDERIPIAIHECGHAIVAMAYGVPLRLITVQPGKKALGRVMIDDVKEYIGTIPENMKRLRVTMGGAAAEAAAGIPPMTGATSDIAKATSAASHLVTKLGVGARTGFVNITAYGRERGYTALEPAYAEGTVADADADVREIVDLAKSEAFAVMRGVGKENLLKIAEAVNERVTMTGNEFRALYNEIVGVAPEALTVG